ncbi:MAG: alkaline phosphatase family protein [candidate division KSB1 bacterium]|nr:alkaline phosphatase family protein [candidate division KSB1 bacterium]MDZ7303204.1 alkaline phosphatase family protein [candidate division KSB1 bacterium]MDZ7312184.1 alkaline phosphatase family protein [candidate division KSB1 bacterium]
MKRRRCSRICLLLTPLCFSTFARLLWAQSPQAATENVVLVIIDGVRYSEGLGDPAARYMSKLHALAAKGIIITEFYNDFITVTRRALPAIWCGNRVSIRDTFDAFRQSTQYTLLPTVFEYFRKHRQAPLQDCQYLLNAVPSLWLPSFHREYGPKFWPKFTSKGTEDLEVFKNAQSILKKDRPRLLVVYFPDVDQAGHSGIWSKYLRKIQIADSLTAELWKTLQADSNYTGRTAMLVTNDHGRHDDQHGGFSGHGDNCHGCQHIMFLALGPDFKQKEQSALRRTIIDIAPTIGALLNFPTPFATGKVMSELWRTPINADAK